MDIFKLLYEKRLQRAPIELKISEANQSLIKFCEYYQKSFQNEKFFKSFNLKMISLDKNFEDFHQIKHALVPK